MIGRLRERWSSLQAEHGSAAVARLYVLHRLLQKLSGGRAAIVPYVLVAQPVGSGALASVKPDAHTVVRRIEPDDPVVAEFPRPREVVAQRFAAGSSCFVAWVKGRFAGYIWIARSRYFEDEVRCVYEIADPARGVWDFDVYVEPSLRLGRTLGRLWRAVDEVLAAEGVCWTFSRINRFNAGSINTHRRLGAVVTSRLLFVVLGRAQLYLQPGRGLRGLGCTWRQGPAFELVAPATAPTPGPR